MFSAKITVLAGQVINLADRNEISIVTAESCTGGLIAAALTSIAGSSRVVYGGFVSYANAAKMGMLDVPPHVLDTYGAVSEQAALAMVEGALAASNAGIAVAVTGVAGPGGGSAEKPVGLVHFACATLTSARHVERRFGDIGRTAVRETTVIHALELMIEEMKDVQP